MKFLLNSTRLVNPAFDKVKISLTKDEETKQLRYSVDGSFEFYGADYTYIKSLIAAGAGVSIPFIFNYQQLDTSYPEITCKLSLKGDYKKQSVSLKVVANDIYNEIELIEENEVNILNYDIEVKVIKTGVSGVAGNFYFRAFLVQDVIKALIENLTGKTVVFTEYDEADFSYLLISITTDVQLDEGEEREVLATEFNITLKKIIDYILARFSIYSWYNDILNVDATTINMTVKHISEIAEALYEETRTYRVIADSTFKFDVSKENSQIKRDNLDNGNEAYFKGEDIIFPRMIEKSVNSITFSNFFSNIRQFLVNGSKYPDSNNDYLCWASDTVTAEGSNLNTGFTQTFYWGINPTTQPPDYLEGLTQLRFTVTSGLQISGFKIYTNLISAGIYILKFNSTITNTSGTLRSDLVKFTDNADVLLENYTVFSIKGIVQSLIYVGSFVIPVGSTECVLIFRIEESFKIQFEGQAFYVIDPSEYNGFYDIENFKIATVETYNVPDTSLFDGTRITNYKNSQKYIDSINKQYEDYSDTQAYINGTLETSLKQRKQKQIEFETESIDFEDITPETLLSTEVGNAEIIKLEKGLAKNNRKTKVKCKIT